MTDPPPFPRNVLIAMPQDFPVRAFNAFDEAASKLVMPPSPLFAPYAAAGNAVVFRFRACAEADDSYRHSLAIGRSHENRYQQAKASFAFFTSGLAAIESLCFAMYAVAQAKDAPSFNLLGKKDRLVTPEETCRALAQEFPGSTLAAAMSSMIQGREFQEWKKMRNYVAHRVEPPRIWQVRIEAGKLVHQSPAPEVTYDGITVNAEPATTATRRAWLSARLEELLTEGSRWV